MKKIDLCAPEDEKLELGLVKIIQQEMKLMAATMTDLLARIATVSSNMNALGDKQTTFQTEVTNAFNRLEAKIAAGADTQPAMDALQPIVQKILDKSAELDAQIAAAQVEGV